MELDLELEIVKAKLQKLNQEYSDVIDAPTKVTSSKNADRERVATDPRISVCRKAGYSSHPVCAAAAFGK